MLNPTAIPQLAVDALVTGAVIGLVGLGIVLIYKASGVANLAHGQIMMFGGLVFADVGSLLSEQFALPFAVALLFAAVFSVAIYVVVLRPIADQPSWSMVVATLAVGITLQGLAALVYGAQPRALPALVPLRVVRLFGGAVISYLEILILVVAVLFVIGVAAFLQATTLGLKWRATAEDLVLAAQSGVAVDRMLGLSWLLAGVAALLAGLAVGFRSAVDVGMGEYGLRAIPAIIIGGFESVPGSFVGGIIVGFLQVFGVATLGGPGRDLVIHGSMLLTLLIRPWGLFGQPPPVRV